MLRGKFAYGYGRLDWYDTYVLMKLFNKPFFPFASRIFHGTFQQFQWKPQNDGLIKTISSEKSLSSLALALDIIKNSGKPSTDKNFNDRS